MWLDQIKDHLVAQGIGTFGTDLFVGRVPDTPDAVVVLQEYGGGPPDLVHNSTTPQYEDLRFQVLCRAASYPVAEGKAQAVFTALKPLVATTNLPGTTYKQVSAIQSPFPMQLDGQSRTVFVQNFQVRK